MLACIHCSMKALLDGKPSPVFDETPEEHMARAHPDMEATIRERAELTERFAAMVDTLHVKARGNGH